MKDIAVAVVLVPLLCLNLTGCLPLVVASAAVGALGGYAASRDTIQGESDKSYDSLWETAVNVSKIRGNVKFEDSVKGYIELDAEGSQVYIRVIRLTQTVNRLRISARKHHLPNLTLAEDIFTKIMEAAR